MRQLYLTKGLKILKPTNKENNKPDSITQYFKTINLTICDDTNLIIKIFLDTLSISELNSNTIYELINLKEILLDQMIIYEEHSHNLIQR